MIVFKPIIIRHHIRLNTRCKPATVRRFREALKSDRSEFDLSILAEPAPLILKSVWINDYTIYVQSKEMLYPYLKKLAKKFKLNMIFSYAEDSSVEVEHSCGMARVGTENQMLKMPRNKIHRFVYGTILIGETPMTFEKWENKTIDGSLNKYYFDHFIQDDARAKIKKAFSANIAKLANMMIDIDRDDKVTWRELNRYFNYQFKK